MHCTEESIMGVSDFERGHDSELSMNFSIISLLTGVPEPQENILWISQ